MESKTKQRIVGMFIVIGLVVILLPLFHSSQDVPPETTLVKAPPFPEQTAQAASEMVIDPSLQDEVLPEKSLTTAHADNAEVQELASNQPTGKQQDTEKNAGSKQPNLFGNHPSIINHPTEESNHPAEKALNTNTRELAPVITEDEDQSPVVVKAQSQEGKMPAHKTLMRTVNHVNKKMIGSKQLAAKTKLTLQNLEEAAPGDNGLASIKGPAWVVQIGSFKSKANALRLVNKLRMNGYHAFMQHVSMTPGDENTRVFVGPETQHARARTLAGRLENDMHLKTIVISYKPLAL